jgi:branched-chain amino acid transport system ATP-binding protein
MEATVSDKVRRPSIEKVSDLWLRRYPGCGFGQAAAVKHAAARPIQSRPAIAPPCILCKRPHGSRVSGYIRLSTAILETTGLSKTFSGFSAVDKVDLRIETGSIHALIGPNGAGKTTCFNLLTKFLQPSAGRIVYQGQDITRLKPAEVARRGMVRSFQISAVFGRLTALENVRIALQRARGGSFDFWRSDDILRRYDDRALALLTDVGLEADAHVAAAELSYGRKRALEIATTLALDPPLLLLDEPTAGMTEHDVERIVALIRRIRTGRTILMVEHNLSVVSGLSDRITVLTRGRILAEGSYEAVANDPAVITAYLGTDHA